MKQTAYIIYPQTRTVLACSIDDHENIKTRLAAENSLDGISFKCPWDPRIRIGLFVEEFAYQKIPQPAHFYIGPIEYPLIGPALLYCSENATGDSIDCPLSEQQVQSLIRWGRADTHITIYTTRHEGKCQLCVAEVPISNN